MQGSQIKEAESVQGGWRKCPDQVGGHPTTANIATRRRPQFFSAEETPILSGCQTKVLVLAYNRSEKIGPAGTAVSNSAAQINRTSSPGQASLSSSDQQ